MWRSTLIMCLISLFFMGCGDDDSGTMIEGLGDLGGLDDGSASDLSSSSIVGEQTVYGDTMVFNADGTVDDGELDPEETLTWALQGNVLVLDYTWSGTYTDETGQTVTESETGRWATTAAIVDGELYVDSVVIRTSGSGESLDGTWEYFEAEAEIESWDGMTVHYVESAHAVIVISGDTYTLEFTESWEVTGDVSTDEMESGSESEECAGVVAMRDGMIVLTPTSGECDEVVVERIAEDVVVIEAEEPSTPIIAPEPMPEPMPMPEPEPLL